MKSLFFLIIGFSVFSIADTKSDFFNDISEFLASNRSLKSLKNNINSYESIYLNKSLNWTPDLTISSGRDTSNTNSVSTSDYDYWQISSTLNIFNGGLDYYSLKSADNKLKYQLAALDEERKKQEAIIANLIFKNIYLDEELKLTNKLASLKQEALKIVNERYHRGQAPLQDITKAQIDFSYAQSKIRDSQLQLLENKANLKNLSIYNFKTSVWPIDEKSDIPSNTSLENQSIVKMEDYNVLSKQYDYKKVYSQFMPSLDLSLTYQELPLSTLRSKTTTTYLTLTLPLWNRWSSVTQKAQAFNELKNSELQLDNVKTEQMNKREISFKKLELAKDNLKESNLNLTKSKNLYENYIKNFKLGRISINDLFIEQSRLIEIEQNYINQQLNFHMTYVETCLLFNQSLNNCLN